MKHVHILCNQIHYYISYSHSCWKLLLQETFNKARYNFFAQRNSFCPYMLPTKQHLSLRMY